MRASLLLACAVVAASADTPCKSSSDCAAGEVCKCEDSGGSGGGSGGSGIINTADLDDLDDEPAAVSPASRPLTPAAFFLSMCSLWGGSSGVAAASPQCTCVPASQDVPAIVYNASGSYPDVALGEQVYVGNGCFWHTQYDTFLLEAEWGRGPAQITSRVGYAGGLETGPGGLVCYHYGPPGSDYSVLGHTEVVGILLDADEATAASQFEDVLEYYFKEGFMQLPDDDRWWRHDPQDRGPAYRSALGLPGGVGGAWFPLVEAANVNGMELREGLGGAEADSEGEFVVYVYDSAEFSFYQGERYHQFHANTVVRRPVPDSYTVDLADTLYAAGELDSPCDE